MMILFCFLFSAVQIQCCCYWENVNMPVFRSDPCGITCIILTYVALFYSDYVIINWVVLQTMRDR